uniref:Solute carrier family 19 member 1 n=1 Tax=Cyprinus carpio TaxID=7962 RepID=A0A8C2L8N3_CYPCA
MQFMEFFYDIAMAARVAYSSYIFSLVPATVFQRVASYSHSSVLMGVFTRGVSYRMLSAVSLGLVIFGLLLSFCLPWPKRSLFFNQARLDEKRKEAELLSPQSELARIKPEEKDDSMAAQGSNHKSSSWTNSVFIQMVKELKNVVKVPSLRLWSLWWVFNSTEKIQWSIIMKFPKNADNILINWAIVMKPVSIFSLGHAENIDTSIKGVVPLSSHVITAIKEQRKRLRK